MKVIFLDIDGVLNSAVYDRTKSVDDGNIDVTRLPLLRKIIDETGAKIVLSSEWRKHFGSTFGTRDRVGEGLIRLMADAGITLWDKTPVSERRADEIQLWLDSHSDVESFIILDDIFFGWGELQNNLVHTNYHIGRGLEDIHVDTAIKMLNMGE